MKNGLLFFCIVLWGLWTIAGNVPIMAQEVTPQTPETESNAQARQIITRMLQRFRSNSGLSVSFRFESTLFGKTISGSGLFQKKGDSFRHGMTFHTPDQKEIKTTILRDGDNQILWTDQSLEGGQWASSYATEHSRYFQLDLDDVERFFKKHPELMSYWPWYERSWLENLVRGLEENVDFYRVGKTVLPTSPQETRENASKYFCLIGHWKKEKLAKQMENRMHVLHFSPFNAVLGQVLPEEIPTDVTLFLDDNYFPYRMEYIRRDSNADRVLLWIQFSNIQWNVRFAPQHFQFETERYSEVSDLTPSFLDKMEKIGKDLQRKATEESKP